MDWWLKKRKTMRDFQNNWGGPLTETAELGGFVPYPDETDATDHRRVSGLKQGREIWRHHDMPIRSLYSDRLKSGLF